MGMTNFEWDPKKNAINIVKHRISFQEAQRAFLDPKRIIAKDVEHSKTETRYYCFGKVDEEIITVRCAGYWRKGRKIYEKAQG